MIREPEKRAGIWLGILISLFFPLRAWGYEETTVTNGGSITGFVRIHGKIPKLAPLKILKAKEVCKNVPNEGLVVGRDRGLRYAVVALEGITKGIAVEREAVHEMDNLECRFVPHVQAASIGQFLVIKNSDPILHTAHAYFHDGQPHFNIGLFPGKVRRKPLVSPGVVKVLCEVHPWMIAYIVVTEHPYHAVTDVYGEYEIRDVPPGTYRIKVWHERLGTQEKQLQVKGGTISKVDFTLSASEGAKK